MYMGGEEKKLSFEKFPYTGFAKVTEIQIIFNNKPHKPELHDQAMPIN